MILSILTVVHIILSFLAIGAGTKVLLGMLSGKLAERWAVIFFRCSLAASVAGLLFPLRLPLPMHWLAMSSVYVSGAAIVGWRKFQLVGIWRSIFSFSTTVVLCLNILLVAMRSFEHFTPLKALTSAQSRPESLISCLSILVIFGTIGAVASLKFTSVKGIHRDDWKQSAGYAHRISGERQSLYATNEDFCELFRNDMNNLFLLSFLLTANHEKAEKCFLAGLDECTDGNRVFHDWAHSWARRVIIRNAIGMIAPHAGDGGVPVDVAVPWGGRDLQNMSEGDAPFAGVLALSDFERCVYVLSILEKFPERDCALLLSASKQAVSKARMCALQHIADFDNGHRLLDSRPTTSSLTCRIRFIE